MVAPCHCKMKMEREMGFGEALRGVIASFFNSAEKGFRKTLDSATRSVDEKFEQYKNSAFLTLLRLALYIGGIALITGGIVVFAARFLPTELILLVFGLLIVYAGFVLGRYELRTIRR